MILNLEAYAVKILLPIDRTTKIETTFCLPPFSADLLKELTQLGAFLMRFGREFPNIVAAGYWLRKSNLLTIKSQYPTQQLKATGCVFHIAPGNVDTLFFYSMMVSVLCGNQTILRLSNKLTTDSQVLLDLINQFFCKSSDKHLISSLITVLQYEHNDLISSKISSVSTARVIWGSNKTIKHLSQFPLYKSTNNICFPDRYSVAIIQINTEAQIKPAVENLLCDIQPYFQQACSSPKVVYWLNTKTWIQEKFWRLLSNQLNEKETLDTSDLMAQLLYLQRLPLLLNTSMIQNTCLFKKYDPLHLIELEFITLDSVKYHCGLWVLLSVQINRLNDVKLFDHCQSVTLSGIEPTQCQHWQKNTQQPMKRIIPAGQALTFSHKWDGVDLVARLSVNF